MYLNELLIRRSACVLFENSTRLGILRRQLASNFNSGFNFCFQGSHLASSPVALPYLSDKISSLKSSKRELDALRDARSAALDGARLVHRFDRDVEDCRATIQDKVLIKYSLPLFTFLIIFGSYFKLERKITNSDALFF